MSHARTQRYHLTFSEEGGVELTHNGATVWSSDADPDFMEEFGDDALADEAAGDSDPENETDDEVDEEELVDDVLDYLVEAGYLTETEATTCQVYMPKEPIQ